MRLAAISIFLATIILFGNSFASACNTCHSKNPKMVKMHKELGSQNCFSCHSTGKIKPKEELKDQMQSDTLCIKCHKK